MRALITTIIIVSIIGCSNNKEGKFPGLLSKEKMQVVLWDVIGADVFTEQFIKKDSFKNAVIENMKLQNRIFSIHKVSKEIFYKSYDYYILHPEDMKVILDSMTASAERDRSKMLQNQYSKNPK
jgi:hypothetical protein